MPSSIQEPYQLKTGGSSPTTSFGTAAAGWATEWMDVRYIDEVNLGFEIDKGASAILSIQMESSSEVRIAASLDDADIVNKVETNGDVVDDVLNRALAADGNISVRFSTRSMELLRVVTKVDVAGAVVTGSVSYDVPLSRKKGSSLFTPES